VDGQDLDSPGVPGGGLEAWKDEIQLPTKPSGFLELWYDAGLALPKGIDREKLISNEIERITHALIIVTVAGTIPRRLGGEATDEELAVDKKRAKRVGHVLRQSLASWTKTDVELELTDRNKKDGAQLEWALFAVEHCTQVKSELRLVATWALQNEEARWGRSAVVYLENELRWIIYALRD